MLSGSCLMNGLHDGLNFSGCLFQISYNNTNLLHTITKSMEHPYWLVIQWVSITYQSHNTLLTCDTMRLYQYHTTPYWLETQWISISHTTPYWLVTQWDSISITQHLIDLKHNESPSHNNTLLTCNNRTSLLTCIVVTHKSTSHNNGISFLTCNTMSLYQL